MKAIPFPLRTSVLPNGLRVVVVPYDSPGIVAYWTIVRAGSRDEVEPGLSGFAHFFEHMMFRGTERHSREEYNAVLKDLGADHNAFTTDDYTGYHILGPSAALETLMAIEADRFTSLKYSVEDFRKEAGAVLGEYHKNAGHPFQTLHERLRQTAFREHTYRHTTIGFLRDIQEMPNQYDYSLTFFDRFYRPEHCILLLVGDLAPEKVFDLARAHYGAWKPGAHATEVAGEPPQESERRATIDWTGPTEPYLYLGYRAPAFSTTAPDAAALDLAAELLFSESAPLYQRLVVEEQLVDILHGGLQDHRDPYLFTVLARIRKSDDVARVEGEIASALQALRQDAVPAERLARVQSHLTYAFAMGLDTASGTARNLAHYLALTGDVEAANRLYALYERITPGDILEAARVCFAAERRTVVMLRGRT